MRSSPDILIPLVTMNPSGGVRMIVRVANALAARGHAVALGVPTGSAAPPVPLDPRVTLLVRPAGRAAFVTSLPRARVHVATGYATPLLIACGAWLHGARPRLFHLIQGDEMVSHIALGTRRAWQKPALRMVARAGYRLPTRRVAVSRFVADRVGAARISRVIAPGIDEAFLATPPPERAASARRTVGVIAHPAPAKGVGFALDALATLSRASGVQCVVFDGAHTMQLPSGVTPYSRYAAATGLGTGIFDFYSACDAFVFPSLVEGFGLPPLEAMARGAATVVSDCGGIREYARDGENCLLVGPGSANAIAAAVRRILDDDGLRARLRTAGRATAERFTAGRFAEECASEIEQLLDGGRIRD